VDLAAGGRPGCEGRNNLQLRYTELHFHILPGIDDGPPTMAGAVELARAAAAEGTRTVVATPHVQETFVTDVRSLPDRVQEVTHALQEANVPIRVMCGGELAHPMVARLSDSELDVIAHGPRERRWLLLEAPLEGIDDGFARAARSLRERGFHAVIAHPERALGSGRAGREILTAELAVGSALQVNAWSVAGVYGEQVRGHALRAIRSTSAVALASDAHGPGRPPALRLGIGALARAGVARPGRLAAAIPASWLRRGLPVPSAAVAA
jgi:protein-tyrosine phosphatase